MASQTDLCGIVSLALNTMPETIPVENVAAVNKRETITGHEAPDNTGPYPRRWAGTVKKNWGPWVQNENNSDEWRIEISSKKLQETVTARVNEDRKEGEPVQFTLDPEVSAVPTFSEGPPITLGRLTTGAQFKKMRNKGPAYRPQEGEWKDNPQWREDLVDE